MMNEVSFTESILNTLDSFFSDGRKPHAMLIDGGSREEREALSLLAAKMLVCENPRITPCGECENCRKAKEKIHPDIITVKKPDDKKHFVKDDVKRMVGEAYLTPNEASTKVYIISEVQLMTEESQNLLLKILEEPPVYTSFILTAQTANAVIGTVLSRVVRLRLGKTARADYSEKAESVVSALVDALASPYEIDKIVATAALDGNKQLTAEVLDMLCLVLRDAIAIKTLGNSAVSTEITETHSIAQRLSLGKLLDMYDKVSALLRSLENNPNYTLLSAVLCASL